MKPAMKARRIMLASLLAGTAVMATGCSSGGMSLASMNPFSNPATPSATPTQPLGVTATLASAASGAGKQVSNVGSSVGNTAKRAWKKTSSTVAGVFKGGSDDASTETDVTDPLSLSGPTKKIGPDVFVANGQLWESTGDYGKAMESYTKALESEANNGPALTSIARLHFRQGNHKQAADYFQRAILQNPNDAGLHNDLGLTLNKLGDSAAAGKSLEKALELAPGTSRYANNLASVQFEAGDTNAAYQVLATNNKPAVAHFNMAYLYFKSGQVNAAREHLAQVMKFEPQATTDPAIQRAVERSRDMLAQINTATMPIAQAAPQATIAASNQFLNGKPVQQVSQSQTNPTAVSPAASVAPAGQSMALPVSSATGLLALQFRTQASGHQRTGHQRTGHQSQRPPAQRRLVRRQPLMGRHKRPRPLRRRHDRCRSCRLRRARVRSRLRFHSPCHPALVRTSA